MELPKDKIYKNRGVERNKTPLQNIVYHVEISKLKADIDKEKYEKYKYGDGYLYLLWSHQKRNCKYIHGFVTIDELKELIGTEQYRKFTLGKREFIIQRRIDGKNIKK